MAAGDNTYLDNDGKSVQVALTSSVAAGQIAYVEGFLGIAVRACDSGDYVALNIDRRAYQFTVPAGLTVNKGDIVYVDTGDLTGHIPDETAYYTATDTGRLPLFKAIENKDANNVVVGILLWGN